MKNKCVLSNLRNFSFFLSVCRGAAAETLQASRRVSTYRRALHVSVLPLFVCWASWRLTASTALNIYWLLHFTSLHCLHRLVYVLNLAPFAAFQCLHFPCCHSNSCTLPLLPLPTLFFYTDSSPSPCIFSKPSSVPRLSFPPPHCFCTKPLLAFHLPLPFSFTSHAIFTVFHFLAKLVLVSSHLFTYLSFFSLSQTPFIAL